MKQRLDGRFLGGGFHTTCEKLGVHLFVAKIFPVECLQERSESSFCHILVGKSCQIAPAGLDDKRIVRKLGRHIAFPENRQPALFGSQIVGEGEERLSCFCKIRHTSPQIKTLTPSSSMAAAFAKRARRAAALPGA